MIVTSVLQELVLIAGVGVIAAVALVWLKLPTITGLLLAGAVVGPYGLALVHDLHQIEILAEVGVVLLLFTIGLEFSLARLVHIWRLVTIGGSLQVGLTTLAVMGLTVALGGTVAHGIFFGFLAALSSTAIVLRALGERNEMDAPHGRFIVGALIFQDLCVVPMMLLVPILAGKSGASPLTGAAIALGKAAAVVAVTLLVARWLVPRVFAIVDRTRSREIFLLLVLVVCLGTAWLTSLAGLSLALGAFLAGVVLADSDYGHRAMAEVLPLRDLLTSVFFMSLGMLFDARALTDRPLAVGLLFVGLLVGKSIIASIAGLVMRFPPRVAVLAGVGLAQFSEFGFVLAREGSAVGLLAPAQERVLLAAAVLTMVVTPVVVRLAPHLAAGAHRLQRLARLLGARSIDDRAPEHAALSDHVVVVGYGVAGKVLVAALRDGGIPYIVLEINAESVRRARAAGEPAYYGDIASAEALAHARVAAARSLVLLINDPAAAERAIVAAKRYAPSTPVFVRTHYLATAARLRALGASDVIVEEVEAGLEMLARAMRHAGAPLNVVTARLEDARAKTQSSERDPTVPRRMLAGIAELADMKIESFLIEEGSPAANRSVVDLQLRSRTGALLVAVRRASALLHQDELTAPLHVGDVLFLVGSRQAIREAIALLGARQPEAQGSA